MRTYQIAFMLESNGEFEIAETFQAADDLEIRIGGRAAQSVLPPSRHPDGSQYTWVVRPTDCPVARFPAQLLAGVACA